MAASIKVEVDVKPLQRLGELLHQEMKGVLEQLGEEIVADAKTRAPVLTGALRDSLESEVSDDLELTVHDGVAYGIYQEMGTRFMPARPFLGPAVDQAKQRLPDLVREGLERAANEAAR